MATDQTLLIGTADGVLDLDGNEALPGRRVGPFASQGVDVVALVDSTTVMARDRASWHEVAVLVGSDGRDRGESIGCAGGHVIVGTAGAHVARVRAGAVEPVDGFDNAPTRDEWYTPWAGPADVRSLTVSADGTLLVNVHVGGILRSTDAGETWKPTIDLHCDVHQVLAHPTRPGLVVAAAAVGLCRSTDDGVTWEVIDAGLHATYLRAVSFAGDSVLVSASTGPAGTRSSIYHRLIDAGADTPFRRSRTGLPEWLAGNIDTFCLVGEVDGTFSAFGDREGGVFVSEDAGLSWEAAQSGLAPVVALALARR
jgi:photosystem II stability/assembly factor-like uncharacterized protein